MRHHERGPARRRDGGRQRSTRRHRHPRQQRRPNRPPQGVDDVDQGGGRAVRRGELHRLLPRHQGRLPLPQGQRTWTHRQRRLPHLLHGQPRPDALRLREGRRHRPQLEHGQGTRRRQHHRQRRDAGTGRDARHAGVQRRRDVQPHDAEPGDQGARLPRAPRLPHRLPRQRRRRHDLRPVPSSSTAAASCTKRKSPLPTRGEG